MARLSLRVRSLLAFVALPGVVAFAIPLLVARFALDEPAFGWIGLIPLVPGVVLLLWCVRDVTTKGEGTLAPWDPPRRLVSAGPYRRSRNPMYLAVGLILAGWAAAFESWTLAFYGLAVMAAFHLRVVLVEEPELARTYANQWPRYSSEVPRWVFPGRTALLASLVALAIAVPVAGLFYEAYADAKTWRDFPPSGMHVDVGGRRLHLICSGEDGPTVIFEASGFGSGALASPIVRERVAAQARVCSYDRMGTGWSDPGPSEISAKDLATDLAVLQDRAGLHGPYILVGSSIGGLTVEMFARHFPERVAGLVFLDAATSTGLREAAPRLGRARSAATIGDLAAHLGLIRLLNPFHIPTDSEEGRRTAAMTYGSKAMDGVAALVAGLPRTLEEFDEAPPLPTDVPLVVLSAEDPDIPGLPGLAAPMDAMAATRLAAHQTLARASTRGTWRLVFDSDHLMTESQPEVVVETVLALVDETRAATVTRVRRR